MKHPQKMKRPEKLSGLGRAFIDRSRGHREGPLLGFPSALCSLFSTLVKGHQAGQGPRSPWFPSCIPSLHWARGQSSAGLSSHTGSCPDRRCSPVSLKATARVRTLGTEAATAQHRTCRAPGSAVCHILPLTQCSPSPHLRNQRGNRSPGA